MLILGKTAAQTEAPYWALAQNCIVLRALFSLPIYGFLKVSKFYEL